jgi:hypothetical protein
MQAGIAEVPPVSEQGSSASAGGPIHHRFAFRGEGLALFTLILKNMLLTLVTLGIWRCARRFRPSRAASGGFASRWLAWAC